MYIFNDHVTALKMCACRMRRVQYISAIMFVQNFVYTCVNVNHLTYFSKPPPP